MRNSQSDIVAACGDGVAGPTPRGDGSTQPPPPVLPVPWAITIAHQRPVVSCSGLRRSVRLEGECEMRPWEIHRTRQPRGRARRVLDVQPAALGLLPQVAR
jgi:hypothetical protein